MTTGTVKNVSAHDVEVMLDCEVVGDMLDMVSNIQAELEFEAMVRGEVRDDDGRDYGAKP